MGATPEFRRKQAQLAANTRWHPAQTDEDRQVLAAASRERKLRQILGAPPAATNWIDHLQPVVDDMLPLTPAQREKLPPLLLQQPPGNHG
jgi:hypothetical protein